MSDPTLRFGNRSRDYAQYRPSYPQAMVDDLPFGPSSTVADVGAGTGLFTRLVARNAGKVYALEPNAAMADQGRSDSREFANVEWCSGTGEATGLEAASIDGLTCAQAFHWLDRARAAAEWRRILKPGAPVVLVWNERDEGSPLQDEYEALLNRWCPEYPKVNHRNLSPEVIEGFFSVRPWIKVYRNDQRFDLEGFRGRLRSASYCPAPGQPGHDEVMAALGPLFDAHVDSDGLLTFPYVTRAYLGQLD